MSNILVFIQTQNSSKSSNADANFLDFLNRASLSALVAALDLKKNLSDSAKIYGICLGPNAKSVSEGMSQLEFSKVFFSEDEAYQKFVASSYAKACLEVYEKNDCKYFVAAATSSGKDFSAYLAAKLDGSQASDITKVLSADSFKRPVYAGNAFVDVQLLTDNKIITVRSSSFDTKALLSSLTSNGSAESTEALSESHNTLGIEVLDYQFSESDRPELADAEVVISGGRGVETMENFEKIIFPLAEKLNAAVGGSRAVVDSGEIPNDWQVGQTGKVIAPNLYIALGLSGAIQHLAGMKDSKTIVAINTDPEAPIFEVADYGVVGDVFEVVPELTKLLS